MTNRLLDRQLSLINYLTSAPAIFGDQQRMPVDPPLDGIDRNLLHLEARFSHEKRMEKIAGIFRHTLKLLGSDRASIERAFVETSPPTTISRVENAHQFLDFLVEYWRRRPHCLPYLADLAACEFALAQARDHGGLDVSARQAAKRDNKRSLPAAIRRHPGVVLVRCCHDVRGIFTSNAAQEAPTLRDVPLAVIGWYNSGEPEVVELDPAVYDLLAALNDWTLRQAFGETSAARRLIKDLVARGLLETRG
jgi:hypothetical protein